MRWLQAWRILPRHSAGAYQAFRLAALLFLLFLAWVSIVLVNPYLGLSLRLLAAAFTVLLIVDIVVVNTVVTFVRRNAANSLRSAVFLVLSYCQLAIAFAVLYLSLVSAFALLEDRPLRALYFSVVTMATAGLATTVEDVGMKRFAEFLVILQLFISFYFVALLVATVMSNGRVSDGGLPTLEELLRRVR